MWSDREVERWFDYYVDRAESGYTNYCNVPGKSS